MKSITLLSLFGTIVVANGRPPATTTATQPMRDAATHEQVALLYRKAASEDPMTKLKATTGPDPSKVNQPLDLISQSDIICFNGIATLVPKRAILHIPKNVADRLKFQPGSKIQSWESFYALNRGWITTVEVSRIQAEGNSPLAEDTQKHMVKGGNLVVATMKGGPISVLAPKAPAQPATPPVPQS